MLCQDNLSKKKAVQRKDNLYASVHDTKKNQEGRREEEGKKRKED